MSKLLVVFAVTGRQGGSVANYVLKDPELLIRYRVRGITRETESPVAQELQKRGAEIVYGDVDDPMSLVPALTGAHTVFSSTESIFDGQTKAREIRQGKAIADAAVASGAQYIIFSTLPSPLKMSNGKFEAPAFDAKADVEEYIRSLPIKSAFYAPGSFMEKFGSGFAPRPAQDGSGTYHLSMMMKADTAIPLFAALLDTGKFVGAILADPEKYKSKTLAAATRFYTWNEVVAVMSRASGKTVKYIEIPAEVFGSFFPPQIRDAVVNTMRINEEYGLYGEDAEEKVEWSAKQARGKLTTLEEYFKLYPLNLK